MTTRIILPPTCRRETIISLSNKYMDKRLNNDSPDDTQELLDHLVIHIGGQLSALDSAIRAWDAQFPEPSAYDRWDSGYPVSGRDLQSVHEYLGTNAAREFLKSRQADIANDFRMLISGQ